MKTIKTISQFLIKKQDHLWGKALQFLSLFSFSFTIAFLCHLFFLSEWLEGRYMTGIGDGISQMLPFKKLLYDAYTSGNFFYSNQFGMGGGIYSQLGYYFSTSITFLMTVAVTFVLESLHLIQKPDLFYWADAILVISIIRMSLIISVTTLFFRYIHIRTIPAFIGAILYGTSIIYFRHVTYWEFFADAMLWLPLLLFGIEKIIKEKKSGWFIIAVSISLFDNFYFAYINFLVAGIYIVCRWFIPFSSHETSKVEQIKMYVYSGIAGFGISAISFIPAVYGYLNNHRIPYEDTIPLFGIPDNLLVDSRIVVLPAFVILCLFMKPFYKNTMFRFFSFLTILSIVLHFSPIVASAFNGFSAPQYRWEYFLSLVAGGVAAISLQQIHRLKRKHIILSIMCTSAIYVISLGLHYAVLSHMNRNFSLFTLKIAYLPVAAIITIIIFALYGRKKSKKYFITLTVALIMISIYTSNVYQMVKLPSAGSPKEVSRELMHSDAYNGEDQLELIRKIKEQESDPFYRIDWMINTRNNTPIVQDFNGFSVYSSILNKHLLYYYLYDLEIDMGRESVSRYGTLGDRANLYSILGGKYYIAERDKEAIPYGFDEFLSVGNYVAYKNTNILPLIRTTKTVFSEDDLMDTSPIAKEKAMLEGIVLENADLVKGKTPIPESKSIMKNVTIDTIGASYQDHKLEVKDKYGGIDLIIENPNQNIKDYYVSFSLQRLDKDQGYNLSVNEYVTSRKKNTSIYKTGVNKLVIRVSADERISIRVPEGIYELADIELYEEDYQLLKSAKKESELKPDTPIIWSGNKAEITYNNATNDTYMALPIPYEKGWSVYINGQKSDVLQANYAFIGFQLQDGINDIKLIYYPPYFFLSLFMSILSLMVVSILIYIRKRQQVLL